MLKPLPRRHWNGRAVTLGIVMGVLATAGASLPAEGSAAVSFTGASPSWPASPDWQQYVQTPESTDVRPTAVVSTSGEVSNADALTDPAAGGVTTLTATPKALHATPVTVSFPATTARYVRLDVSKLGLPASNDTGGSYVQLAELAVFGDDAETDLAAGKEVTTSESLENFGWSRQHLTDGVKDTEDPDARGWTTLLHQSPDVSGSHLWATIDLGAAQSVSSIVLWPRTDTLSTDGRTANFPVDYTVQTATTDSQAASFTVQKTVTNQATPAPPVTTGPASIVLDYGHDVGGYPWFDVDDASGTPTLQAGYSETKSQISPTGDGVSPWASGDSQRFDTYQVTGPGRITNKSIQGGQRYEVITLTTPGTVSLSAAGITYTPYLPPADPNAGNFVSSSDELNKLWHDGSYTTQLNQVPIDSVGARWSTEQGALDVPGISGGTAVGPLKTGATWTDYTVSFKTKIVKNQAGWMVRGSDASNGYVLILSSSDSTDGAGKNVLQQLSLTNGVFTSIKTVALAAPVAPVAPGTWHTVKEVVSGTEVTTSIDGTEVATFDSATFGSGVGTHAAGTIGFREFGAEEAMFADLAVTAPGGATLYANDLSDDAALGDFSIPGSNTVPLILDGAKRDRAVWSGDLAVEGPSVYYTTNTSDYLKGSLELLGSWAGKNGYVAGAMPPTTPISPTTPDVTQGGYSANYSMYFVRALADYYLYTGDSDFVTKEWPIVARQLAYNASLEDSNGLVVTDNSNGADWDYYDGNKTGEVTTYNALYYQVLRDGAKLAAVAGHPELAEQYDAKAATVKSAINAHLFNTGTGLYNLSNTVTDIVAQDANVFAILFGIAPADKVAGILAGLKTSLWTDYGPLPFSGSTYQRTISPFISGFELNARFEAGDTGDALQLLSNLWGPMIAPGDLYTGTFWENISTSGVQAAPNTNMAHGWSTMPTSALSKYVLGVQPVEAGYAKWLVQPHPGDLDWTKGQAPTPHGPLVVNWSQDPGVGFAMHVEAPPSTAGTIAVPTFGKSIDIEVNGTKVWSHGAVHPGGGVTSARLAGEYVELEVGSGAFDISTGDAGTEPTVITPSKVTIQGQPEVGGMLTARSGSWGVPVKLAYAWLDNDRVIRGATRSTYRPTIADRGDRISVRVTASATGADPVVVTSKSVKIRLAALTSTPRPTVTGVAKVGHRLTVRAGAWRPAKVRLSYRWLRDGSVIPHASRKTYLLRRADRGAVISVRVTGSKPGYAPTSRSRSVGVIR